MDVKLKQTRMHYTSDTGEMALCSHYSNETSPAAHSTENETAVGTSRELSWDI